MTEEEDEVLFSHELDDTTLSRTDRILLIIEDSLNSDEFLECQDAFADRHCELFDLTGDLPPQCMKIYKEYVALVESKLLQKVHKTDPTFDFDELLPIIRAHKSGEDFAFANVFEILNATIDFNEFRALMASYKNGKNVVLDVHTVKLLE
jgi:hypothetical protein